MTIISNLIFYIFTGYIGSFFGIPLTGIFFYIILIIFYFSIILYIIISELRKNNYDFLKPTRELIHNQSFSENFGMLKHFKKLISVNGILLILFIFLICILDVLRVSVFIGRDPWLHIFIIKKITHIKSLPVNEYYGSMGLHIYGAIVIFFSGVDFIILPKFYVFYTIFLSALIFYNLLMRIFKNQNLAIFGVFILEFSSLGFSNMMLIFWPSSLALIQCLFIFFLLYIRLQDFIRLEKPTKKVIFANIFFSYIIILLVFISSILTHSVVAIIFLISFWGMHFIYFVKDYRRGIDFIFLSSLVVIFLMFYCFSSISNHFFILTSINKISGYLYLLGAITVGLLFWRAKKSILFTTGRYRSVITGNKYKYYKKIEDKLILPFSFSIVMLCTITFLMNDVLWLNLRRINIFLVIEILIIIIYAIWGMILFQKKPKGKPLSLWGAVLAIITFGGFIFDFFTKEPKFWERLFYLTSPFIVIGLVAYIHKLIKIHSIKKPVTKILIIFSVGFSLLTTFFDEFAIIESSSLKKRDISIVQKYSKNTSVKNVIISRYFWIWAFMYYDYPYEHKDEELPGIDIHYFLQNETNFILPENHINEIGENLLRNVKSLYNTEVYLFLSDEYLEGIGLYGYLTEDDIEKYYSLDYLNKIFSSKTMTGDESAIYWVI